MSLKNPSMGCLGSVRAAPLLGLLTLALAGCTASGDTHAVRDRANAECAEITVEMRGDLQGLYQRVEALAVDDARLLPLVQHTTQIVPFRNPSPCFGHPSLAPDVPQGFRLERRWCIARLGPRGSKTPFIGPK